MEEGKATIFSSLSKPDGDLTLSGSDCYLNDLTEDSEVILDASEEAGGDCWR